MILFKIIYLLKNIGCLCLSMATREGLNKKLLPPEQTFKRIILQTFFFLTRKTRKIYNRDP